MAVSTSETRERRKKETKLGDGDWEQWNLGQIQQIYSTCIRKNASAKQIQQMNLLSNTFFKLRNGEGLK